MRTALVLLTLTFSSVLARSRTRFSRYQSWNSRMYPVWQDDDPRYRDCWKGGEVTFDLRNDAPTLTGAKATFNVDVHPPQNQTVLPDGQVVWNRNCTVNGTRYIQGQPVYSELSTPQEWTGTFPDGTPFTTTSTRKPRFIFVWKTWGRYWQVADGPSSALTIGTDNIPLGSYNMEVVIYHCRGKDKFIPLGYASTQFSITDQIPFTVTLTQIGDVNEADQNIIQNRPVSFSISLHDPSQYLSQSDVTFNWDFGDNSGTLISRESVVTHTYTAMGSFRPQVVLMAAIPNGCDPNPTAQGATSNLPPAPVEVITGDPSIAIAEAAAAVPTINSAPADPASEAAVAGDIALAASVQPVAPAVEEAAAAASVSPVAANDLAVATDDAGAQVEVAVEEEAAVANADNPATGETATVAAEGAAQAADDLAVADADGSLAPAVEAGEGTVELAVTVLPEAPILEILTIADTSITESPVAAVNTEQDAGLAAGDVINTVVPEDAAIAVVPSAVAAAEGEVVEAVNDVALDAAATETVDGASAVPAVPTVPPATQNEVATEVEAQTETAQVAVVVAKRQAPEMPTENNCMIYRYGSFSTNLDVVQGIESVEIVQVNNAVVLATETNQNAVDLTVTCQGSLPNEVCTVVSDADCATPVQTACNTVAPDSQCQMILRQFFNNSGTFCINVSLTNDVSFAVTSARVSVTVDSGSSAGGAVTAVLGVLVLVCAVGATALTYRRFKQYRPLREDDTGSSLGSSGWTSVPLLLWNLLRRQSAGESHPLLQGRVV